MVIVMKKLLMKIKLVGIDRKYIRHKLYLADQNLPQQKMLRKILEKVFITKNFTQCKTSRTLKIDLFEIPDDKNI